MKKGIILVGFIAMVSPLYAQEAQAVTFPLFKLFQLGGSLMWLLLFFAILSLAFILERIWEFSQHQFKIEKSTRHYIELFQKGQHDDKSVLDGDYAKNDMVKILDYAYSKRSEGYDHIEKIILARLNLIIAKLEKGLNILLSIGNIAPLTGFLGTVSGMIAAFQTIAAADQVNARMVAGGIFEALITTAFGLIIAIFTMIAYNYFVTKIDNYTKSCEALANDFMEKIAQAEVE